MDFKYERASRVMDNALYLEDCGWERYIPKLMKYISDVRLFKACQIHLPPSSVAAIAISVHEGVRENTKNPINVESTQVAL